MISDEQKHPFGDKKESVEESSSERKFNFLQLLLPNAVFPFGALLKKKILAANSRIKSFLQDSMQLIRWREKGTQ